MRSFNPRTLSQQSTEGIIDEDKWLRNWTQSMCEMAGECPGGGCESCRERFARRAASSPTTQVERALDSVREAIRSVS